MVASLLNIHNFALPYILLNKVNLILELIKVKSL